MYATPNSIMSARAILRGSQVKVDEKCARPLYWMTFFAPERRCAAKNNTLTTTNVSGCVLATRPCPFHLSRRRPKQLTRAVCFKIACHQSWEKNGPTRRRSVSIALDSSSNLCATNLSSLRTLCSSRVIGYGRCMHTILCDVRSKVGFEQRTSLNEPDAYLLAGAENNDANQDHHVYVCLFLVVSSKRKLYQQIQ